VEVKKELLLVLGVMSSWHGIKSHQDEKMLARMVTFPSPALLQKNFSIQENTVFSKTNILEKVGGRTLLLTTVIRLVYYAYRTNSMSDKQTVLRMLLCGYCNDAEIEWALDHMRTYVARYGDDEQYLPWS
jgi:hypothetical protein